MNTPRVTIRLGALSAAFHEQPQGLEAVAVASEAGGRRRHDTPFSFDIVFQPLADDTPPLEVERDGKGRYTTPFTFELTAPWHQADAVESRKRRIDTSFAFERRTPSTDGGLTLTEIRESVAVAVGVSTPPEADRGKGRSHTTFIFEVTAPLGDGTGSVRVIVSTSAAE